VTHQKTFHLSDFSRPEANFLFPAKETSEQIEIHVHCGNGEKKVGGISIEPGIRPDWMPDNGVFILPSVPSTPSASPDGLVLARFAESKAPAVTVSGKTISFAFDPLEIMDSLLHERYVDAARPLISKLPFDYHRVPAFMRVLGYKLLPHGEERAGRGFPAWPVEPAAEALRFLVGAAVVSAGGTRGLEFAGNKFWPGGKQFAVVLSHDMDTARSFAAVENISGMERERGFRSCWNVVGASYRHDHAELESLRSAGHEIALHGDRHDNKLSYLSEREIEMRLDACGGFIKRYEIKGFRSPSLLTSDRLDAALARRFLWSSSAIDTDINSIIARRRGVCSVFPFYKGYLLELPITVPMDDRLIMMGIRGDDFVRTVMDKIRWIASVGGIAFLGNHPEPHLSGGSELLDAYRRILDAIAEMGNAWFALPGEVASLWRELTVGNFQ
jgi:peptidoglycan/xylan/chitin deacetylase (PgdA/CDA1 family)